MIPQPPRCTRTYTLIPYTTPFRSSVVWGSRIVAPANSSGTTQVPAAWLNGPISTTTSLLSRGRTDRILRYTVSQLRWLSITPFGEPSVPDVKLIDARPLGSASGARSVATNGSPEAGRAFSSKCSVAHEAQDRKEVVQGKREARL